MAEDYKKLHQALKACETRFHNIIEKSPDGVIIIDKDGIILFINPATEIIFDSKIDELVGKSFGFPIVNDETTEIEIICSNKKVRFAEMRMVETMWDGDVAYLASIRDITERRYANEEHIRLATAIDQAAEIIFITDTDGTIQYVNPAFEQVTGYTRAEVMGKTPGILKSGKHDEAFYQQMWDTLTHGKVWKGHFINKKKDGTLYEEKATISPVRNTYGNITNYVAVKRNITQEVMLEAQLRQAQKMEAIGTLAGGIFHDFKSILSTIIINTEIAISDTPENHSIRHELEQVLKASKRAEKLIKQILTFSRQDKDERSPVKISSIVKDVLNLIKVSLSKNIKFHQNIEADSSMVMANRTQIHQVLMNLCTNAAYSMHKKGGVMEISLVDIDIHSKAVAEYLNIKPGPYLKLTVSDTGHGIDRSVMERLFDPFFTTKGPGKGTGLGLSVVNRIVKNHDGTIKVFSEPGKGAIFDIFLPRVERK